MADASHQLQCVVEGIIALGDVQAEVDAAYAKGIYLAIQFVVQLDGFFLVAVGADALEGDLFAK